MNFKGTQTEKNMQTALSGESLARNKYTFYAMQARSEGNTEIADLFERMAKNETTHAKIWFNILNEGLGHSEDNLKKSADGENSEWMHMYPEFAKTAREEGLEEIAQMFEKVAEIESDHEHSFLKALIKLKKDNSAPETPQKTSIDYQPETVIGHRCMFCGGTFEKCPDVCPVCEAIGSFEKYEFEK